MARITSDCAPSGLRTMEATGWCPDSGMIGRRVSARTVAARGPTVVALRSCEISDGRLHAQYMVLSFRERVGTLPRSIFTLLKHLNLFV